MAEGRSNSAIAQRLVITDKAVSKHCTSIFVKLDLLPSPTTTTAASWPFSPTWTPEPLDHPAARKRLSPPALETARVQA